MVTNMDTEFMQNRATMVINCSSRERLQEIVDFLINCPDPTNFSYEGEHAHYFVVFTKKNQIHVNRLSAPNCIKWFLQQRPTSLEIPNLSNPNEVPNSQRDDITDED